MNESVSPPCRRRHRGRARPGARGTGALLSSLRAPAGSGTASARPRRLCRPAGSAVVSTATPRSRQASLTRARKARMLLSQQTQVMGVERDPRRARLPRQFRFHGSGGGKPVPQFPASGKTESRGHRSRPGQSRRDSTARPCYRGPPEWAIVVAPEERVQPTGLVASPAATERRPLGTGVRPGQQVPQPTGRVRITLQVTSFMPHLVHCSLSPTARPGAVATDPSINDGKPTDLLEREPSLESRSDRGHR